MNRAAFRRLLRALRPARGRHRGQPKRVRRARRAALQDDMAWLGELIPATPPAEPRPDEPWQPRVTRYIRLTFWFPDDTVFLPPGTMAMVLDMMARTRSIAWDAP